jgi:hypothetical protein
MNNLQVQNSNVPAYLQADVQRELESNKQAIGGITGTDFLPSLSVKGKCFSIRANGDIQNLQTMSLDVVIIAARPSLSKVKYPGVYNPKENAAPVCASIDSVEPDFATKLIDPATGACCHNCKSCYFNQFGSSEQGMGKACKDYKRLVVMLASQDGKTFPANAPALILDVPATSLKSPRGTNLMMLRECVTTLQQGNVPLSAYVITLKFVMSSEFPQLVFEPKRWVLPQEMERIKVLREAEAVKYAIEEKYSRREEETENDQLSPAPVAQATPVVTQEVEAPKRKRRTKAEIEAAQEASAKPFANADEPGLFDSLIPPHQKDAVAPAGNTMASPAQTPADDVKPVMQTNPVPPVGSDLSAEQIMAQADAIFSQFKC